jgi:membrane glycosyltransferase
MPTQSLRQWTAANRVRQSRHDWALRGRRLLVFAATFLLTAAAGYEMYQVLSVGTMTALQTTFLIVFTMSFIWIALPFVSGLLGFITVLGGRVESGLTVEPLSSSLTLRSRNALLMPIYNEAPSRIFAGMQAMYEALDALGALEHFDLFILSDTTEPNVWLDEELAFTTLRRQTSDYHRIFYRHRPKNFRRKAGNIADFCERWGANYDHMVVLDADSLMTGETLVRLAATMEANPAVGLLQTLPQVVNRNTLFARAQQFAARLYGPVIAAGVAFWHGGDSNYWGHNAIIRTQAFVDHAGLPDFTGQPPFGGHILSHDFVEAALMRRAGWKVHLLPTLAGSYEESPPSLLDFAERDRRWCQGNLQHLRVLPTHGLYWMSRLHLITGIFSYLASPIWLLFIGLGLLLALQAHFIRPEYFAHDFALFPTWPVFDAERAMRLFICTMAILVAPKLFGYLGLLKDRETARRFGGWLRTGVSVVIETVLSALVAPVMMVLQTVVVVGIFTGRAVGWNAQRRDDGSIPLRAIVRRHIGHTLFGIVFGIAAYTVSPPFLAWMSPMVLGLLLAIPVSAASGQQSLGRALRRLGLLTIPEENDPPDVLQRANALAQALEAEPPKEADALRRLAGDAALRALHLSMLPTTERRRQGEFDVDLLLGIAKLDEANNLEEAAAMLSSRETLAVLGHRDGFERLQQHIAM